MTAAVFVVSLLWLAWGIERSAFAGMYCDPVSRIRAQDEAVYGHEVLAMAATGNWLTPTYLGRYALNKPPLLIWLAALGVKIFGIHAWAMRLPSLVAGALLSALVFALGLRYHSAVAALGGSLLLVSSHLFYVFARLVMTDMLLTLCFVAAVWVLATDPCLGRARSAWLVGLCSGAGIMTKGAAGVLPLLAVAVYAALLPRHRRPRPARLLWPVAIAFALALPWHLYQLWIHPRWFTAEYILTQHLAVGLTSPPQHSSESHLLFYSRRLFAMDPALAILAAIALIPFAKRWRRHTAVIASGVTVIAALGAFRYRSAYYVLPLLPLMALIAASQMAALRPRFRALALVGLCAATAIKLWAGSPVWGIPAGREWKLPEAAGEVRYCQQKRGNELIIVEPNDEYYSSDLPLNRVRYCFIRAPSAPRFYSAIDFDWLGVSVTVDQFDRLDALRPLFLERLKSFDMSSDRALATVIWAGSEGEEEHLIAAHPEADFSLPAPMAARLALGGTRVLEPAEAGRAFLLSTATATANPTRACGF
jgi:hypothetical protein